MEPTPPAAPVTSTSPSPGLRPCFASARTHSAAVNPAVPTAIAWRVVKGGSTSSSHFDSSRAFCERPPQDDSPSPHPVTTTRSPGFQSGLRLASTTPARSIPGTIGHFRTMAPLPVTASASL